MQSENLGPLKLNLKFRFPPTKDDIYNTKISQPPAPSLPLITFQDSTGQYDIAGCAETTSWYTQIGRSSSRLPRHIEAASQHLRAGS